MTGSTDPFGDIEELIDVMTGGLEPSGDLAVDVADTGEAFAVVADLPGYDRDDIDVQLTDSTTLTVSASRETEAVEEADRYVTRERHGESITRRVGLPEPVVESEASASYEQGVLTVTLPKRTTSDDGGTDIPVN
ncbi:heat shock protein Hsp20 [Halosimplex carlsbadense 2-9-1]|uniref:Heat shock protein Hsp20 n=1 Tax=Halosimplex carlsbadense 2-9-1 TaxID=797114 RepID=M0D4X3_9EURY|nr:Hsp20/alpha crystallin family protein [Halosimplex carlsbadense]ELZ29752.1 heat shock protein Hsp20 [Halosimplex carlsbadense 2-9-1]